MRQFLPEYANSGHLDQHLHPHMIFSRFITPKYIVKGLCSVRVSILLRILTSAAPVENC